MNLHGSSSSSLIIEETPTERARLCVLSRCSEVTGALRLFGIDSDGYDRQTLGMVIPISNSTSPASRRWPTTLPWLLPILMGCFGFYVVGMRLVGQHNFWSDLLNYVVILVGSLGGVAFARSVGYRTVFAAIFAGAAGCAITLSGCFLLGLLLIPPDPNYRQKFGDGIGAAMALLLAGLVGGAVYGGGVGLVVGSLLRTTTKPPEQAADRV